MVVVPTRALEPLQLVAGRGAHAGHRDWRAARPAETRVGSRTSARASATRCRWPPESCRGLRFRNWSIPRMPAAQATRFACSALGTRCAFSGKGNVLVDGHVRIERVALEHHRDAARAAAADRSPAVPPISTSPAVGCFQPADHAQQRRLAAPGWSQQHQELAVARDARSMPIDGDDAVETLCQPPDFDDGHGYRESSKSGAESKSR